MKGKPNSAAKFKIRKGIKMELRFAITTVIEIAFVVAFLYALWHEGKIIAFEERMEDAVARWLAKKIINRRRRTAVDRRRQNKKVR